MNEGNIKVENAEDTTGWRWDREIIDYCAYFLVYLILISAARIRLPFEVSKEEEAKMNLTCLCNNVRILRNF